MTESEDSVSSNSSPTSSPVSSPASSPAPSPSPPPTILAKSPVKKEEVAVIVQRPTLAHPPTAVMVTAAIKTLNDKKGSTLQAIKKYLALNYHVNLTKFSPFICKYLKTAVVKGDLIQTKGSGALGNFKLPIEVKKPAVKKKKTVVAIVPVTKKKPDAKKTTAVKTATSGKRSSIEGTKESDAKKSKKVTTTVVKGVKPKSKTVKKVVAKNSPTKTKKVGSAAIKSKTSKVVAKKTPVKKTASKKK